MTEDVESIPQANELLYTMKLRNGDEVLFTLVDEGEEGLVIEAPIKVSVFAYADSDGIGSQLITQKWIIFSESEVFMVPHFDIITYAPMAKDAYKLYVNAVNRYSRKEDPDLNEVPFFMEPSNTLQ